MQEQEESTSRKSNEPSSGSDSTKQQECSVSPINSHTAPTTGGKETAEPATEVQVLQDHVSQSNSTDSDASSAKYGNAHVPATAQTAATDVTGKYFDDDEVASASTAGEAVPTVGVYSSTAVDSSSTSEVASIDEACTASVDIDLQDRGHLPAVVCRVSSGEGVREAYSMQSSPIYGVATTSSQALTPTQRNRLAQNAKQGVHRLEIESSPQLYFGCMAWYISWLLASWPPTPPLPTPDSNRPCVNPPLLCFALLSRGKALVSDRELLMHHICLCHASSITTCGLVLHTFVVQHIIVLFDWPVDPACSGCPQYRYVPFIAASMPVTSCLLWTMQCNQHRVLLLCTTNCI